MNKPSLIDPPVTSPVSPEPTAIPAEEHLTQAKELPNESTPDTALSPSDQVVGDDSAAEQEDEVVAPTPAKRSLKKGILLGLGALVLAAGSVTGWRWWQFQQTHVTTENAQIQGHLSPLSARIPATVQKVLVKEGDRVQAGQPLVLLEDEDLNLKIKQAEANLAIAQAQLRSASDTVSLTNQTNPVQVQQSQSRLAANLSSIEAAQADVAQAEAAIETNQAKVAQAQTEVNRTGADFRRYQALYQEGAVSAQQFDVARTAYENAQANLTAVNRTVNQAQAALSRAQAQLQRSQSEAAAARGQVQETQISGQQVTVQEDQRQLAQAQVDQAKAALALARQQVQYTVVKAPVSGYVGELTAQVGQKVQAGQPMLSVVPLKTDEVYVQANFKETALGKLQIGEKAEVEIDAYPGQKFTATIAGISPATGASFALIPPDNATGNYNKVVQWVPVRLVFDASTDPQHKLRPGLSVSVTVDTTSINSTTTAKE